VNSMKERFDRRHTTSNRSDSFHWVGGSPEEHQEVLLFYNDGYLHGMIHFDSVAINIEPLDRNLVVFTELDPSSFDDCHVEEDNESNDNPRKEHNERGQQSTGHSMNMTSSNPVIDIMVAYTPQSAGASGDIQSLIDASIQSTNVSLQNSGINASVNLVQTVQVNYNDSGNMYNDLNWLMNSNTVSSLRDQYGADIVKLLVASATGLCGTAAGIEVISDDAFAVTRNDCSVGNYTFAHEIGHLIGARHDNDPVSNPRAYAHGFVYNPAYWRTVMAVNQPGINRIPYWSNPSKSYGGVAMGTSHWNDNARVWYERAETVSNFQSPSGPPPQVNITGPSNVPQGQSGSWDSNVSGGTPPYNHRWYVDESDGLGWKLIGMNSSVTHTNPNVMGFYLKLVAIDANQNSDELVKPIGGFLMPKNVEHTTEHPEHFNLIGNYPNPFNPTTNIVYELPEQSNVEIHVFDIMGRHVSALKSETKSAGRYSTEFNAFNLSSGLYIARLRATGLSGETFIVDHKMQLIK